MKMPTGAEMIKAERRRQITKEKWTAKHDQQHTDFSLAAAARCYERCARFQEECGQPSPSFTAAFDLLPKNWPWEASSFKLGRSAIRTLVKAGALYQAEVDRIRRVFRRRDPGSVLRHDLKVMEAAAERTAKKIDQLLK